MILSSDAVKSRSHKCFSATEDKDKIQGKIINTNSHQSYSGYFIDQDNCLNSKEELEDVALNSIADNDVL